MTGLFFFFFFFFFFSKCSWQNTMRASTCNREIKITLIIVLNLGLSGLEKHMRSCLLSTISRHTYPYHLEERIGTL